MSTSTFCVGASTSSFSGRGSSRSKSKSSSSSEKLILSAAVLSSFDSSGFSVELFSCSFSLDSSGALLSTSSDGDILPVVSIVRLKKSFVYCTNWSLNVVLYPKNLFQLVFSLPMALQLFWTVFFT